MPTPKMKPELADDDFDEDEFLDEEEDDLDEDQLESLLDEEEDEPAAKVRPGSKRTPAPDPSKKVRVATDEDEDEDEDFEQALGRANEPSKSPGLKPLDDDQLVIELTDLILQGEDNEMVSILHHVITGLRGPKVAKQLVREARDRAIAKIRRVANVAQVTIDFLGKDDD